MESLKYLTLKYLTNRVFNSIFFNDPSHNEILNIIMTLKNKATEHDNVLAFFLKVARHVITPYLLILIQFSFNHGIFPNNCKIARVIPIFKSSNREDPINYRPISILTCFSKIFCCFSKNLFLITCFYNLFFLFVK